MLTGKCKEDFEKWFENQDQDWYYLFTREFYELPFSMQYGVYVDFFDSVGFYIQIYDWRKSGVWCYYIDKYTNKTEANKKIFECPEGLYSRVEARQKAIEKANEIYNQNKEQ